ncbi:MAG: CbtA family protein [Nitrosarchaeum sp.]|nr:CbtA family protein [Nitrosarchaeum sp.]
MKTFLFVIIVIASGTAAGVVQGGMNLIFVEPSLDQAIGIENQHLFAKGEAEDNSEFWIKYDGYRIWQKSGQVLAGAILGASIGSLFGIVFAFSKNSLPGKTTVQKSLILAGIMWLTVYLIPFLKYPGNPPGVGESETVVLRGILYLTFIALSGFGALGFYKLSKKLKTKKLIAVAGYATFIGIAFIVMPQNHDPITLSMDLINSFRMMSAFTVSVYWISLGLFLGFLWNYYKPDKEISSSFH